MELPAARFGPAVSPPANLAYQRLNREYNARWLDFINWHSLRDEPHLMKHMLE